ncbi:hypothetical protein [Planococcus salinarum]|uniref:hypothetical protein n=1 Tax=Planococcus salinarum TaxID=622695 RepID=UPI000E3DC9B9|nr:hypothetical protein [Planococcus salinarum]TAA70478.1 hypothetical protein D2909_11685 [Planococcus salinarum]
MKTFKNEKGYALLMVLMLILLFTVLGMGLMATNMNSAKQFNMKEEQVQARHQAEMGLLHYKSRVQHINENFVFQIDNNATEQANLEKNALLLCNLVDDIDVLSSTIPIEKKDYEAQLSGECGLDENNRVVIPVISEGSSREKLKKVQGSIKLNPPTINLESEIPEKPERPPGFGILPEQPDITIIDNYSEINGPFISKKSKYHFLDSFVVNQIPENDKASKKDRTFEIAGGKSDQIIVEKDLYVDGKFFIQNHACVLVRGDLTINGDIEVKSNGGEIKIIVYGDALILGDINLKDDNYLYVKGNTFLGEEKEITVKYKTNSSSDCSPPSNWPLPEEPVQGDYYWNMQEELNPTYL